MTELSPDHPISFVRVTNRNPFPISDRFNGTPVRFEPNVPKSIPVEVAQHILGYPGEPEDLWRHMSKRWGWNLPEHIKLDETGLSLSQRYAQNIKIEVERFELKRVRDPNEPIPADEEDVGQMIEPPPGPEKLSKSERMKKMWAERRAKGIVRKKVQSEVKASEPAA